MKKKPLTLLQILIQHHLLQNNLNICLSGGVGPRSTKIG